MIAPLFGGLTEIEILAHISESEETDPYKITRKTFASIAGDSEEAWNKFLHDGFLVDSSKKEIFRDLDSAILNTSILIKDSNRQVTICIKVLRDKSQ